MKTNKDIREIKGMELNDTELEEATGGKMINIAKLTKDIALSSSLSVQTVGPLNLNKEITKDIWAKCN